MTSENDVQIVQGLACLKKALLSMDEKLRVLRNAQDRRSETYETKVSQENIIAANKSYMTPPVANPGFRKARIEIAAGFDPSAVAGIEVYLVFGNSPIQKMSDILCSNGAAIYLSEEINIDHFSGFSFQLRNKDVGFSALVRSVKIAMYR
jgi:hypothetical protein